MISIVRSAVCGVKFANRGSVSAAYDREAKIPDPPVPDDHDEIVPLRSKGF
jgi:hypothetical protein